MVGGTPPCPPSTSFNIDRAPAVVHYMGRDSEFRYLYHGDADPSRQVTFEMRFDAADMSAFFKIRVPVGLKGAGPDSAKTPLFLHIHPDSIAVLKYNAVSRVVPDVVKDSLGPGPGPSSLDFWLVRPADMVVPSASRLAPQNKAHGEKLDSLKLLAQDIALTVYWMPATPLSDSQMRPVCDAIWDRRLKSISAAADLQGLYGGAGGRVLERSELCLPVPKSSPPSYSELEPGPPGAPVNPSQKSAGAPRKRRRGTPSGAAGKPDPAADATAATCRKLLDEMMAQYRREERAHLDSRLAELRASVGEDLRALRAEVLAHVDQRLADLEGVIPSAEDVDEQVAQHAAGLVEDLVEVKIDDHVAGIRAELEEFVDGEIASAEERVLRRVRDASWSVCIDE
ncbi:hypothetical protein KVR01_011823 [Diaporthe batatas]|uniref:uncharacterized protein n=1 Tax=Diaporthe batatas TaxID=748121 RepID=UPI001D037483|nr:uncharacterized protein KVR01_011823 [Diaporthe batatas]KAG8158062.1 hypothetical protein KVR01_011823 [Diaporthe batatas]